MKTICTFFLGILVSLLLLCSHSSFGQKDSSHLKSGIKEIECVYAQHYVQPDTLTFAFSGNPKYVNYYFADLKKYLYKVFTEKGIPVSFINGTTDKATFLLKIDKAKIIHKNEGYDREMRYELVGVLHPNSTSTPVLSFTIVVKTIHDINQQNKEVAEYLLGKVLLLE